MTRTPRWKLTIGAIVLALFSFSNVGIAGATGTQVTPSMSLSPGALSCGDTTTVTLTLDGVAPGTVTPQPVDLVYVLDDSGSIGASNFTQGLQAIHDSIAALNVDPANVHVGIVEFDTIASKVIDLTDNKVAAESAALSTTYRAGNTATYDGLALAQQMLNSSTLARSNARKVIVTITDGVWNYAMQHPITYYATDPTPGLIATIQSQPNWVMYGVGIGTGIDQAHINLLSTDPDSEHAFMLSQWNELTTVLQQISADINNPAGSDLSYSMTLAPDFSLSGASATKGTVTHSINTVDWTLSAIQTETVTITYVVKFGGQHSGTAVPIHQAADLTWTEGVTPESASYTDQTVDVTGCDQTAPLIIGTPSAQTVEATGPGGAVASWTDPTAHDAIDGDVPVSCQPPSGSTFVLGTTTVTCSASDQNGNVATSSFDVTVQDTTPPVIGNVPGNQTLEATGPAGAAASWTGPTATDLVDGNVAVSCDHQSGATFPLGTTTVTCNASDSHGNPATAVSFSITVQDTTPPVIAPHADITTPPTSSSGAVVTYSAPTTTDAVSGNGVATCVPASGSTFALGTTTVNCTAQDAAGNPSSSSFKVNVVYSWSGFLSPISSSGTTTRKAGSTLPVKFQLTGDSASITGATATLTYARITNGVAGPEQNAVSTSGATTGNLFRYNNGVYIFNWDTTGLAPGTYQLSVDLGDGVPRTTIVVLT